MEGFAKVNGAKPYYEVAGKGHPQVLIRERPAEFNQIVLGFLKR